MKQLRKPSIAQLLVLFALSLGILGGCSGSQETKSENDLQQSKVKKD